MYIQCNVYESMDRLKLSIIIGCLASFPGRFGRGGEKRFSSSLKNRPGNVAKGVCVVTPSPADAPVSMIVLHLGSSSSSLTNSLFTWRSEAINSVPWGNLGYNVYTWNRWV